MLVTAWTVGVRVSRAEAPRDAWLAAASEVARRFPHG
jgi:hypothetical protein